MRAVLIVIALALAAHAENYSALVKMVERDCQKKQREYNAMARADAYKWEFVRVTDLPWCQDSMVAISRESPQWVEGYGPIIATRGDRFFVGVKSWIDSQADSITVTRVFCYENRGGAWSLCTTYKAVQEWVNKVGWVCQR